MKVTLNDEFEKFMDIYAFLHDISNDHGIDDDENIKANLKIYENKSKELVAKEVVNSNSVEKVWVCVIGDFSSGKSSFINSILGESVCPVALGATTSSITKFIYADERQIILNDKEISQSEYENIVRHGKDQEKTKTHFIEYQYPFSSLQNIAIFDTPGFANSQNSNDEIVTMNNAKKSDVALLVVDINQGDINNALLTRCQEINKENPDLKWHIILNKADTMPPSNRDRVKNSILQKYDFIDKIFVYSAKDSENKEFLGSKQTIISTLKEIGLQKDEIIKNKFKQEKMDFYSGFEKTVIETRNMLEKAMKITFNIAIEDFEFLRKSYNKAIKDALKNNLEKVLQQTDTKRDNGVEEFAKGALFMLGRFGEDLVDTVSKDFLGNQTQYYHDMYLIIKDDEKFIETMKKNLSENLANEILLQFQNSFKDFINEENEDELLNDSNEFADNTANEIVENFAKYIYTELLDKNNPKWQVALGVEDASDDELKKAIKSRITDLYKVLKKEGFDDFCEHVNNELTNKNDYSNLCNDFNKEMYKKTIDKIDEFMNKFKSKEISQKSNERIQGA